MYIKFFKKFLCLSLFVILMASCDGNDCIEADDFGEYDVDVLTVDARDGLCEWIDDDDGGSGSETVAECLNLERTTTLSFGGICDVPLSSESCSSIKDCLVDVDRSCLNEFSYTGTNCTDIDDSDKEVLLTKAYETCMENCITTCLTDSFMFDNAFEPDWAVSTAKTDDSAGYGITISSGQTVNVQVLGSVSLFSSLDKVKTFASAVSSKKIQMIPDDSGATYFYSTENIEPVLAGKWCENGDISSCSPIYQVGEFSSIENISARHNFLRRGILAVNSLPAGGVLDSEGIYSGPDQEINYGYWECSYDENSTTTTCATNYPDSSYKSQNDSNYAMNNSFVKILGGTVVPTNANKFVLNNPFSDIQCETDETSGSGGVCSTDNPCSRICHKTGSTENLISDGEVSVSASNVLNSNPYFLGYSSGIRKISISSVYPVKLAFAIIDGGNSNSSCRVSISQEGSTSQNFVNIKANGNWFFATSDGSATVFNKSQYNTLKSYSTYDQDLSQTNAFNLTVNVVANEDSSQTWEDGDGKVVSCGNGLAVFIIPQNEVLINKSGFVSFKDLLGNFVYCSGTLDECAGASMPTSYDLSFNVINPMYDFRNSTGNISLLEKNFYEYPTAREVVVPSGSWSSDVFVRKGQILRFDESNWFNVSGNTTDGYTIERRSVRHSDGSNFIYNSTGDGLVLRIEQRPALLCLGTATETIDNPNCTKVYDSSGNVVCQSKTYSELCSDSDTTDYCPMGCYCTRESNSYSCVANTVNYISSADSSSTCIYVDGVTQSTCTACQNAVDASGNILPTTTADIVQCYDLESYDGAVSNLTNLADTALYSIDVATYGELTVNDYLLGAKKLGSIFDGGTYGNLEGMAVDTSYADSSTGLYSEYRYNSPNKLSTSNKYISFFVIENSNFDSGFSSSSGTNMYSNNNGEYQLIVSPEKTFNNGEQLAVALALDGWNGQESDANFKKWIVKYNIDKTSADYGNLDTTNSPYSFDSNGYLVNSSTGATKLSIANLNVQGLDEDEFQNLRLYFKIIDKQEESACDSSYVKATYTESLCKCKSGTQNTTAFMSCSDIVCDEGSEIETSNQSYCVNSYYNNSGSYSIKLKTPRNSTNVTGYVVEYVMKPILEVIDGKNIGLKLDNNEDIIPCTSTEEDDCNIYFPQSEFNPAITTFGNNCIASDNVSGETPKCYENCSTLDTNLYKTNCKYFNNGGGFLQRFYVAVITDNAYQIIVKLCFTLMIMFYGMYYLMGMADLTHGELVKRIIKIGFIYLMIGEDGWKYYNMYFVKFFKQGVDYVVFAVAGAFDESSSLTEAFVKGDFYDKSVLFSGVDKNLSLLFSDPVSYKIWGLFFVSFFGWLYVFMIYSSILTYIFSVANALLLYLTAQFFMSLLLAFGPIFFILLIFEKTKEMFNKWLNNLISFALEQVFLLTCLSLFNVLVYNIIKFVLSYRVCWKPVWEINIPILGSLKLMSFWKATTAASASAAASAIPGLFQILLIYLIAELMSKFIEFATDLGTAIGGAGVFLKSLSADIKTAGSKFYDSKIAKPMEDTAKNIAQRSARKLIGYKTAEEEKKEDDNSKTVRKGLAKANIEADKTLAQYKKMHATDLMSMTAEERNKTLSDVRAKAFKDYFNSDKDLQAAAAQFGVKSADDFARKQDADFTVSRSLSGALTGGVKIFGKRVIPSLRSVPVNPMTLLSSLRGSRDRRFGAFTTAEETAEKMKAGKTNDAKYSGVGLSRMGGLAPDALRSERQRAADYDYRRSRDALDVEYGNWFKRVYRGTNSEYNDKKKELKANRALESQSLGRLRSRDEVVPESSSSPSKPVESSEARSVPATSSSAPDTTPSGEASAVSSSVPASEALHSGSSSAPSSGSSVPSSSKVPASSGSPTEASSRGSVEPSSSSEALVSSAPSSEASRSDVSSSSTSSSEEAPSVASSSEEAPVSSSSAPDSEASSPEPTSTE